MKPRRTWDTLRSDYTYTVRGNVIAIIDLNRGSRSVTTDIENILDDIRRALDRDLSGYAVIYRDSMGNWDGVRIDDKGLVEFYALRETEQEKAVTRLLHPLL